LQTDLKKKIPQLEIERPFRSILRIADLCWEERKLVLEIQCSPISSYEAEARKRDYSQEGYDLVWLLDDRLFNKKRLKVAEERIRKGSAYFISLHRSAIYDQFEFIVDETRLAKGAPLPVDLSHPIEAAKQQLPLRQLKERKTNRYFPGDLYDRAIKNSAFLKRLVEYEETLLKPLRKDRLHWIKKGLHIGLEQLLRTITRENH
jgi:competence protein CoiA